MLARRIAIALVLTSGFLTSPARAQQEYAPGRPAFTLGERLQQWGRNLMGEPEPAAEAKSSKPAARTNHPNYHRAGGGNSSSAAGSSRRTAQPTYQPKEPQAESLEPIAEESFEEPPSAPAPVRPAPSKTYTPSKETPASASAPAKSSVQPRTLQEALFNSRPTREPLPEDPPSYSSNASTSASSKPKPAAAVPTPAPVPAPRLGAFEAPLRTARKPDPPESDDASGPALEEPLPVAPPRPVAAKEKPAISPRPTDGLLFTQKSPVLAVEAKGPRRTAVGKETKFKIAVRNTGEVSARDLLMVVQIPAGAEVISANPTVGEARLPATGAQASGSPDVLRWSVSEMPSRSQEELELLIVPRKNEAIDLVVQWTFAPDTQQILVDVQEPKLQMQLAGPKEVSYGEKVIYKLTFSNPGDADAENVVVTLPAIGAADGPADSHTIGTIRAGESKVVEMELVARQVGRLAIKAEAEADAGLHAVITHDVTVRRAGVKVDLEGPKNGFARTSVNYKVTVTNSGNAAAANVQVAAQLPPRAKYVSSTDGGQASGDRVTWTLDSLEPGQQQVLQFKCQLENTGMNRLQAAASVGELKDVATLSTDVEAVADLTMAVSEPAGVFAVGEEVTYEIRIKNRGTTSAEGVNVVAFFSDGMEAISATGARYEVTPGRIQFGTIPSIAADKELVLKIKARADQPGNHVFRAEAQCTSLGSKLAQEGTTRFYGETPSKSKSKSAEPEATEPTPAEPPTTRSSSSADRSSSAPWSGSSRRRGPMPTEALMPETQNDGTR